MRSTQRLKLPVWLSLTVIGMGVLTMVLLPTRTADAGNWPIDVYSTGQEVARAPLTPLLAPSVRGGIDAGAPLPVLPDNVAPPPIASLSGDTYLLFADGFYARNETSSWMPYVMFGAAEDTANVRGNGSDRNPTTPVERELRLGIGLHRQLLDRMDLTLGYRGQYQGPSVIDGDHDEPVRHDVGLRLRYRF